MQKTPPPTQQIADINIVNKKIAIVAAQFNHEIVDGLIQGTQKTFIELGGLEDNLILHKVPGAVEIPLACQQLLQQHSAIDGIIALGCVVRGDTSHFDYVCQMVSNGIMQVMLSSNKPIGFGILTTENMQQAQLRSADDSENKGTETLLATLQML